MKNNLSDLNNHLFAMLEELGDDDSSKDSGRLDQLLKRARSMCDVSSQILRVADMQVKAVRMAEDIGMSNAELPALIAVKDSKKVSSAGRMLLEDKK